MTQAETACPDVWGSHFLEYRGRLLALARRNLNPVLARRVSAEDVVQEALLAACGKMAFFENNPEIPVYFKLRMILFQTLTDMERKHLQCLKRDACRERLQEGILLFHHWKKAVGDKAGGYSH